MEFLRSDEAEAAALALDGREVPSLGPILVVQLVNPARSPDRAACMLRVIKERPRRPPPLREADEWGGGQLRCSCFAAALGAGGWWLGATHAIVVRRSLSALTPLFGQ